MTSFFILVTQCFWKKVLIFVFFFPHEVFLFPSGGRRFITVGSGLENGRGIREYRNLVGASSVGGHKTENEILAVLFCPL